MARIVIFGGQGYLGLNMIKILGKEHQYLTLGRRKEKISQELIYEHSSIYDLNLSEILTSFDANFFIVSYFGNPHLRDINKYNILKKEILGIYEMCISKPKLIFLSTQLIYSNNLKNSDIFFQEPIDFYGKMCLRFEKDIINVSSGNHLILVIPIVYGGNEALQDGYNNIFSVFLDRARKGQKVQIFGTGSQIRSFVHIEDVVMLLNKFFSENLSYKRLDICFNEYFSIFELGKIIASKFNVDCENVSWPETQNGPSNFDTLLDSFHAMSLLRNKWNVMEYLNLFND